MGRGDKFGAAFAGILLMVSLHFLEGSEDDGRRQERCQHITDLVETYGRMSGTVTGEDGDDEDSDDENGEKLSSLLACTFPRVSDNMCPCNDGMLLDEHRCWFPSRSCVVDQILQVSGLLSCRLYVRN